MEDNSNIIQQLNIAVGAIVDKRSFNENASVINKWLSEITKRRTIPIGWENSQKVISQLKEIVSLSEKLPNAKGRNAKIVSANSDFNVSELKKYIQVLQEAQVAGLPTRSRRLFTQMRRLAGDYKHYQKQYEKGGNFPLEQQKALQVRYDKLMSVGEGLFGKGKPYATTEFASSFKVLAENLNQQIAKTFDTPDRLKREEQARQAEIERKALEKQKIEEEKESLRKEKEAKKALEKKQQEEERELNRLIKAEEKEISARERIAKKKQDEIDKAKIREAQDFNRRQTKEAETLGIGNAGRSARYIEQELKRQEEREKAKQRQAEMKKQHFSSVAGAVSAQQRYNNELKQEEVLRREIRQSQKQHYGSIKDAIYAQNRQNKQLRQTTIELERQLGTTKNLSSSFGQLGGITPVFFSLV